MDLSKYTESISTDEPRPEFDIPAEQEVVIQTTETDETLPVKRGRGRPKGSKNKPRDGSGRSISYGTQRDKKEVATRFSNILTGATGMAGVIRPHFEMTEQEAADIAEPLAAYAIRQEQYSPHIREFLDKYDVIAAGFAFMAYLIRVWKDDTNYRSERNVDERPDTNGRNVATPRAEKESGRRPISSNAERVEIDASIAGVSTPISPGGL